MRQAGDGSEGRREQLLSERSASAHAVDLEVSLGPLHLANPVILASGTCGYGEEIRDLLPMNELGAVVTKGLTLSPRSGNPPPRLAETPAGLLNSIGLENVGLRAFLEEKVPLLRELGTVVVVNIAGATPEEYAELAGKLTGVEGIDALEVNISCPNVARGGMAFGADPESAAQVTRAAREHTNLPLLVTLSPNVTDIVSIARAVSDAGADALVLVNTVVGMAIDTEKRRPRLGAGLGGLSGPAMRPIALAAVYRVAGALPIPIVGLGGIVSARDALEFVCAGATAVGIGTGTFYHPRIALAVKEGIREYCLGHQVGAVRELVGSAQPGRTPGPGSPREGN